MTEIQESGSRTRTRQAIIDAAIGVLAHNPAASLGDVAAAANVGRTTLHRYFAERAGLIAAVHLEAIMRLSGAVERARVTEGTGASAIHRLCREYFDLGDVLSLIFNGELQLTSAAEEHPGCDPGFEAMIERGRRDGTVDPELPVSWVVNLVWSNLYAGWSYLAEQGVSRHEVLRLLLRSIEGAISAR